MLVSVCVHDWQRNKYQHVDLIRSEKGTQHICNLCCSAEDPIWRWSCRPHREIRHCSFSTRVWGSLSVVKASTITSKVCICSFLLGVTPPYIRCTKCCKRHPNHDSLSGFLFFVLSLTAAAAMFWKVEMVTNHYEKIW